MVWGCITSQGVGRIHRITGIMRAPDYVKILQENLLGTLKDHNLTPQTCIFQQDHDSKHTARLTKAWLQEHDVITLPWPAQSPDLNIIEHLWDHLKRKIRAHQPQPRNVDELWEIVVQEWRLIEPEFVKRLYATLPKRVAEVIKARGDNTSY